eukprot:CAMPEP_0197433812 /NCGR_PEP_ID=MMETSP1175-20131217/1621_1 /TAXON_ID=1003142 /ORGANISM="Triceratium dubium, Strain CCMP147" /LENGTH=264 /DNA_ID=CAMNT_0042962311 /DNA_START=70 /DNA_END=864 /DNA_ORIENTATION=+
MVGAQQRTFGDQDSPVNMSFDEEPADRRTVLSISRLLSLSSTDESDGNEDERVAEPPLLGMRESRPPPPSRSSSSTAARRSNARQLLSVLERAAAIVDRSPVLPPPSNDDPAESFPFPGRQPPRRFPPIAESHKKHALGGGGAPSDALRCAVKRLRVDEAARAEETRRMVTIAMSRTDEAAAASLSSPSKGHGASSAKIQQGTLRVVMEGKIGSGGARQDHFASSASSLAGGGRRVVAVTGGSVVMAPGTPPPTKKTVTRARCA